MQTRYHVSKVSAIVFAVGFSPICLGVSIGLIGLTSYPRLILGFLVGIASDMGIWAGFARGTYITIDADDNSVYDTFFFIKRDVVPLLQIIALKSRRLLSDAATTSVWITYHNKQGKTATRTFLNKNTMKNSDFKDLIEKMRKGNPNIEIAEELLK